MTSAFALVWETPRIFHPEAAGGRGESECPRPWPSGVEGLAELFSLVLGSILGLVGIQSIEFYNGDPSISP